MCPDDPFNDGVSNLVVDSPVVSTTNEKLILSETEKRKGGMTQTQSAKATTVTVTAPRF